MFSHPLYRSEKDDHKVASDQVIQIPVVTVSFAVMTVLVLLGVGLGLLQVESVVIVLMPI